MDGNCKNRYFHKATHFSVLTTKFVEHSKMSRMFGFVQNLGKLLFQFLLIFRKAAAGELLEDSGLNDLYHNVTEIDVDEAGVSGAKDFFMSKVNQ